MRLEAEALSFSYPNGHEVFRGIDFAIEAGETLAILGPNGAGKSTLLSCLANLERPSTGRIFLDGIDMRRLSGCEIARRVGFVPQLHVPAYAYSVREFVAMGRAPYLGAFQKPGRKDYALVDEVLDMLQIGHLAPCAYTEISGGERQQAMLARVIVQQPSFILLDEPTAHLDFGNQSKAIKMVKSLASKGFGVVMTTHDPDHAFSLSGRVAVLDRQARFVVGYPEKILTEAILSKLYQETVLMERSERTGRPFCLTLD